MADAPREFRVLLTAEEAYPALEREFLNAREEIRAGFRIFDLTTRLHSEEAKKIGETWLDLVVHTLDRGVKFDLTVTDFDPVVRPDDHVYVWRCIHAMATAAELSRRGDLFTFRADMHPARVGLLPRLALWRRLLREIGEKLDMIERDDDAVRRNKLRHMPRFRRLLLEKAGRHMARRSPPPPLVPVTHHQKLAVFDRERLYIGGLDLNDRRWDTKEHTRAAEETWHDTQVIVTGPAAQEADRHLQNFRSVVRRGRPIRTQHLLRTISSKRKLEMPFLSPKPVVDELARIHLDQVAKAERLIYLESQFYRDRPLAEALAKRAQENPDLELILILPVAPETVAFPPTGEVTSDARFGEKLQAECVDITLEGFGGRAFIGCPAQTRTAPPELVAEQGKGDARSVWYAAPLIYLHAKVSLFDSRLGIVSSANLNGRSMRWDTEAGVATESVAEARYLKERCYAHWMGGEVEPEFLDDATARGAWAERARRNATLAPEERHGFILPYSPEPAEQIGETLPGVPEEMV